MLATKAAGRSRAAQESSGPAEEELAAFFDETVPAQLDEHDIAGATASVVADGELRLAEGYGYADVEAEEPVSADETLFRIGSVSKSVTGTAIMHAAERGRLDLDADVETYLDEVSIPDTYDEPITLEHLGTHTPGFEMRVLGLFARDADDYRSLDAELADNLPARARPPGELVHYSNYGFGLAGHVLAEATGTDFEEYVRRNVLDPLGMDRSTFRQPPPDEVADAIATGYSAGDGTLTERDFEFVTIPPAGSMSATATDMARFMLAHLQGGRLGDERILRRETVAGMHERRAANHPALNGTGYGFFRLDRGDVRIVAHTGATGVFHSLVALFPDRDLGVFVSYNTDSGQRAVEELLDDFVEEFVPPPAPAPIDPDGRPSRADELEGWYRIAQLPERSFEKLVGAPQLLEVSVEDDGTLVTESPLPGIPNQRWVEVEPLVFREVDGHYRLAFDETDGEISHLFLGSQPTTSFERLSRREEPLVQAGVFAVATLVLLSGLFGWPVAGLRHRIADRPPGDDLPRAARWTAGIAAACYFAPIVALVAVGATDPLQLAYGAPGWFRAALALPLVGAVCTLAACGYAVVAWRDGVWGVVARLHYTLVAIACLAVAWLLAYWNLVWTPP